MNSRLLQLILVSLLGFGVVPAQAGYWHDSSGEVWRNSAGECWHTGYWTPEMAIVGCDGAVAEVVVVEEVVVGSVDATVNFDFDRSDLNAEATAAVDQLVRRASADGRIKSVKLIGHADRIGTEDYNLDLSLRRASAVADYLVQQGAVEPQLVEMAGKGESEPLVACEGVRGAAAIECLAPNRRVDLVFDLF